MEPTLEIEELEETELEEILPDLTFEVVKFEYETWA